MNGCCGKEDSSKKMNEEKKNYPVEEIAPNEDVTQKNVDEALKELNPSSDSMDDQRG